jgi:hypothetical protein
MTAITELAQVTESRLCWPDNKPRAAQRRTSAFKDREAGRETRLIEEEMFRWRVSGYIVSRNHQRIFAGDPGAALWWQQGGLRVLACDCYTRLADNLHAIYLTLDAMRALERWGAYTAEQAAEGARLALPPPEIERPWFEVLGVADTTLLPVAEAVYRALAKLEGEGGKRLTELNLAIEQARKEKAAQHG